MRCVLVSHTHWDREWYRTFQSFRARLVDTIDRVLDLIEEDPGFCFQLDGQTIVLEDYAQVRPGRRAALQAAVRDGRVAIGPWYVQPDSLLPSGEAHVRNLLEGRRVALDWGSCSTVAYTPDSFGHPAQFPQLFAGFGLGPFVYWRGNGSEIAELPAEYRWVAPDGSAVVACHLGRGYFNANGLPEDVDAAVARLEKMALELAERAPRESVLLLNGVDHMLPDAHTGAVCEALAAQTGWEVVRGLLDDYTAGSEAAATAEFAGELCGGCVANLLPGVWSTHSDLKLRNRRCEVGLEGAAEPWAAVAGMLGGPDERPSLRAAWRALLANQAHDSICGCSQDRVHEQMHARYDEAEELAAETANRVVERIAGHDVTRQPPRLDAAGARRKSVSIAVFNPSPHPRSGWVRLPLDGFPTATAQGVHPLLSKNHRAEGFTVDGASARLVVDGGTVRPRLSPDEPVHDVEFAVRDLPAFGWRQVELARAPACADAVDDGREIREGDLCIVGGDDGTLTLAAGGRRFEGLLAFEDCGDRGDTYDFDPVSAGGDDLRLGAVRWTRTRHPAGLQQLTLECELDVPRALTADRSRRSEDRVALPLRVEARVAPGSPRVELAVQLWNRAEDHRLRLLFPTGAQGPAHAATTFDTTSRTAGPADDRGWIHPAPATFCHQGWVERGGLVVIAPGLNEAELIDDGTVAITLLRATGWLSRPDLKTRPGDAGPALPTPGAQCPGLLEAHLALAVAGPEAAPRLAQDFERPLTAVTAGDAPLAPAEQPLLALEPEPVVVSAWKPAEDGRGSVIRLLNPTDAPLEATLETSLPASHLEPVRLDETPDGEAIALQGGRARLPLPAHALRSYRLVDSARSSPSSAHSSSS